MPAWARATWTRVSPINTPESHLGVVSCAGHGPGIPSGGDRPCSCTFSPVRPLARSEGSFLDLEPSRTTASCRQAPSRALSPHAQPSHHRRHWGRCVAGGPEQGPGCPGAPVMQGVCADPESLGDRPAHLLGAAGRGGQLSGNCAWTVCFLREVPAVHDALGRLHVEGSSVAAWPSGNCPFLRVLKDGTGQDGFPCTPLPCWGVRAAQARGHGPP